MASIQTRVIVILLAVLLAVIAVSALVLFVLPSSQNNGLTTIDDPVLPSVSNSPLSNNSAGVGADPGLTFNVSVLQKAGYIFLDKRLLNEGALPVQPPAAVGKANPFL